MPSPVVERSEATNTRKQSRNKPNPSRHSLKCRICNHPDRAAIEFDFLNWRNPGDIVRAYRFRGLSTIYRHAHATGLLTKRRLNLRFAMERIVERVNEVPVTANSVIRAARAVARINDEGQWVDPPSHIIVTHVDAEDRPQSDHRRPRKTRKTEVMSKSRTAPVFDEILLDEPSESASCEPPRINGKPPDPEIVLEIAPSLYGAVQARREAANVRLAPWSNPELERLATTAYCSGRSAAGGAGTVSPKSGGGRAAEGQSVAPPSSSLPEAASKEPARSAERLTSPATQHESRNTSFSTLPEAAVENSAPCALPPHGSQATGYEEPIVRRHTGSSGTANPPFPFDPPPLHRRKPRRRF